MTTKMRFTVKIVTDKDEAEVIDLLQAALDSRFVDSDCEHVDTEEVED